MPVATTPSASPRLASLPKMEERKRPAVSNADDLAPPSKRHQSLNGNKSKTDSNDQPEEYWIENYQKGAIYRAFQEAKRDKAELESRVDQLQNHVTYRDDHIRLIEAWWEQVLEHMELLADPTLPPLKGPTEPPYIVGTSFKDIPSFEQHLNERTEILRKRVETVVQRIANSRGEISPNVAELESRVASLLAQQKNYLLQLDRAHHENQQLSEDLNKKTLDWFKAERREKRLRSAQVQKLEQRFLANATQPPSGENGGDAAGANGNAAETQCKLEEASAVLAKQKEQLDAVQTEIQSLQEENSSLKARRENLTDEDYIRTDVFKQFKIYNEDLIKRINHLEATNKQLRDEAEKLQAERTAFRNKLNEEAQSHVADLERQVEERDGDVTRLRAARDEWFAKANMLEASQKEEKQALQQIKELATAREDRITALELEIQRLKPAEEQPLADADEEIDLLPLEALVAKHKKLREDFQSINKELPALQQAYKRSMALAQKKVMDFSALEDRCTMLLSDKQKADQKYFAVRKDADLRDRELVALRNQNRKSSEIVAQLKEVESQHRLLISNLEKQLSDLRQANATLTNEHRKMESASSELTRRAEASKAQATELTNLVKSRDSAAASMRERQTTQEAEISRLTARVEFLQKERDDWKRKALSNSSEEEEMLRTFALCTVCRNNFKDTVLKTCGHLFCGSCVDDRISNRMRKCPTCGKAFDRLDAMQVHH
ncbi:BRE1 E3 ubiquitin ligase [Sodiomyces alkalinus F11]|uniref:E3 ubiquitin protein ligase n=1 Tax=Sodiomyces alkalinus (strain CBS 110278 / VKM F-3762 / F11) TaxID=1314773 RepID=A0A3N2PNT3_SODAK|nr:BRE1 E3 ubiquitin ligase [Sodiomyces alkalinus F11]ROT36006.1 BRE1 E3 ubiquitin ligase [Sodiomyces alkalinus F11]